MMLIASAPITGMAQGQAGIKAENLDKSVRPADDFFTFATGGWQKLNPLPAAFSRFGSFDRCKRIITSVLILFLRICSRSRVRKEVLSGS